MRLHDFDFCLICAKQINVNWMLIKKFSLWWIKLAFMSILNTLLRDTSITAFLNTSHILILYILFMYFVLFSAELHSQKLHRVIWIQSRMYVSELLQLKTWIYLNIVTITSYLTNWKYNSNYQNIIRQSCYGLLVFTHFMT